MIIILMNTSVMFATSHLKENVGDGTEEHASGNARYAVAEAEPAGLRLGVVQVLERLRQHALPPCGRAQR